jgi:hypothetical protein
MKVADDSIVRGNDWEPGETRGRTRGTAFLRKFGDLRDFIDHPGDRGRTSRRRSPRNLITGRGSRLRPMTWIYPPSWSDKHVPCSPA